MGSANVDYSSETAQAVAELGNQHVRESGCVRTAARRIQEIEMRKFPPQVEAAGELLRKQPELMEKITQMRAIGALSHFRGDAPTEPRPIGPPYDPSKTVDMVDKIWKDVKAGRVLVVSSKAVGPGAPILAETTTTAQ